MKSHLLGCLAATLLPAAALLVIAGPAQAQIGFGRPHRNGFDPSAPIPNMTPAHKATPGFPAPAVGASTVYTPPKPKSYVAPTPRATAPIGAIDSGDTFKPYKPAKGYSTYEHDAPGRKKTYSTY